MFPIAGQTAGPNGLKLGKIGKKKFKIPRATPGPSASSKYKYSNKSGEKCLYIT